MAIPDTLLFYTPFRLGCCCRRRGAVTTNVVPTFRHVCFSWFEDGVSMMRSMRRAAEMGLEGGVVANVSGLVRSDPPCSTIDPEGEVGLKDDLDEVRPRLT